MTVRHRAPPLPTPHPHRAARRRPSASAPREFLCLQCAGSQPPRVLRVWCSCFTLWLRPGFLARVLRCDDVLHPATCHVRPSISTASGRALLPRPLREDRGGRNRPGACTRGDCRGYPLWCRRSDVAAVLRDRFDLFDDAFSVHLRPDGEFLVCFADARVRACVAERPVRTPRFRLMFQPWSRSVGAEPLSLCLRVEIEICGIPEHGWHRSSAERLLSPFCLINNLAPETRDARDMAVFRLLTWTPNPDAIPRTFELFLSPTPFGRRPILTLLNAMPFIFSDGRCPSTFDPRRISGCLLLPRPLLRRSPVLAPTWIASRRARLPGRPTTASHLAMLVRVAANPGARARPPAAAMSRPCAVAGRAFFILTPRRILYVRWARSRCVWVLLWR